MRLSDYLASPNNAHKRQGNPAVTANALYKTENSSIAISPQVRR